jgi:tetratricopeptide (TPR) repeat protein
MTDIVGDFKKMIEGISSSSSQESDILLRQVDSITAHRIRLCAIPHTFNADVLRVLDASLDASAANEAMRQYQNLAAVVQLPNALALHDIVRQQLFQQWLLPNRREEFSAASRRLAHYYQPDSSATAVERTAKENSFVFHMVGADPEEGFKHFQSLYKKRREQLNINECAILVRLIREYETSLPSTHRAWLTLYEAEIASDTRDWPRAQRLLRDLLATEITPSFRSMALLRLGSALRQSGQLKDAKACLETLKTFDQNLSVSDVGGGTTLTLFDTGPSVSDMDRGAPQHLVHYELGLIARDQGDMARARACFDKAISLGEAAHAQKDIVAVKNSMGTLLLRASPHEAIGMFMECLALLTGSEDGIRMAWIFNNLAIAHSNAREWDQSESYYQKSLEIKQAAGDYYGQASTMFNMARVYKSVSRLNEARDAMAGAATLFENVRDLKSAARSYLELARIDRTSKRVDAVTYVNKARTLYEQAGEMNEFTAMRGEFRDLLGEQSPPWRTWTILIAIPAALGAIAFVAWLIDAHLWPIFYSAIY